MSACLANLVTISIFSFFFSLFLFFDRAKLVKRKIYFAIFFSGITSCIIAFFIEKFLGRLIFYFHFSDILELLIKSFLLSSLTEELIKTLAIFFFAKKIVSGLEDSAMSKALIYRICAIFVLGFCLFETLLYLQQFEVQALKRLLLAVPIHFVASFFAAYFFLLMQKNTIEEKRQFFAALAVAVPSAVHGAYNLILNTIFFTRNSLGFVINCFCVIILATINFILYKKVRN